VNRLENSKKRGSNEEWELNEGRKPAKKIGNKSQPQSPSKTKKAKGLTVFCPLNKTRTIRVKVGIAQKKRRGDPPRGETDCMEIILARQRGPRRWSELKTRKIGKKETNFGQRGSKL